MGIRRYEKSWKKSAGLSDFPMKWEKRWGRQYSRHTEKQEWQKEADEAIEWIDSEPWYMQPWQQVEWLDDWPI